MRKFLITKLVCSKCGGNLELSYAMPKADEYAEGQPTGAEMVEQKVTVEPCVCQTRTLRNLQIAVKTLLDILPNEGNK